MCTWVEIEEQLPTQSRNLKRIGPRRESKREARGRRKGERVEAKGDVVADLENLVHNKRLSRGLVDRRRLGGSKGLRPSTLISIIVRSGRNASGVDGTLYLARRYLLVSQPPSSPLDFALIRMPAGHRFRQNYSSFLAGPPCDSATGYSNYASSYPSRGRGTGCPEPPESSIRRITRTVSP